jgi:exopolysaccharide biosynthesis polyprenyl glycosylphosphotransferase
VYVAVLELVVIGVYHVMSVYRGFYSPIDRTARATVIVFLIINLLSFYFQQYAHSRFVLLAFSAILLVLASLWRIAFFLASSTASGKRLFQRRTVVIGTGKDAATLYEQIRMLPSSPYKLLGFIPPDPANDGPDDGGALPIVGNLSDLKHLIDLHRIDDVFVTQDQVSLPLWNRLMSEMSSTGAMVKIVPRGIEDLIAGSDMDDLRVDIPTIEFLIEPIHGWQKLVKRVTDLSIAAVLVLLLSPLFAIIAVLTKIDSRGPVFYLQERLGKDGKQFRLVKFRTMVENAEEETGPVWAQEHDRRATRIGAFLRRFGIDELPQLFNVIKGEMSLVGPRPERPFFAERYPELTQRRLSVKPGITGLAQVSRRHLPDVEEKTKYDLYYIQNYSLLLDVSLMLRTLRQIVREEILSKKDRKEDAC